MVLLGSLVNSAAIILGGSIGLALKKGLSDRIASAVMNALALCVLYIGVSGMLKGENILITILSMVFGTLVGEWIDLDKKINQLGDEIESRVSSEIRNILFLMGSSQQVYCSVSARWRLSELCRAV